jgi:hypothetical protein
MILIAHRGNISGVNKKMENTPAHIEEALNLGYEVEIDVWFKDNKFWLGHDKPDHHVEEKYLENDKFWCHAKNLNALEKMIQNKKIHCFWHQEDDVQLTSRGYLWTYPNKPYCKLSICVLPDNPKKIQGVAGMCLDDFSDINDKSMRKD